MKMMALQETDSALAEYEKFNERRGLAYQEHATQFIKDFPLGSQLSAAEFDSWAEQHGYLAPAPAADSGEWVAHVQKRSSLRYRINNAGTTPRMASNAFTIDTIADCKYEVRTPPEAIASTDLPKHVTTMILTKKKRLMYLMQSGDWPSLPAHIKDYAELMWDKIDEFADMTSRQMLHLEKGFSRFQLRLAELKPSAGNGAIQGLLEGLLPDE